jgi:hypothetical protein
MGENKYQMTTKLPKMYKVALKYSRWPQNMPTFYIPRLSAINPNWDFWSENVPSGNPALK